MSVTNREELRELRARAIYEASIPPHERQDDARPTYFGLDKVRRDRFRKLAEATIRTDELADLAVVPKHLMDMPETMLTIHYEHGLTAAIAAGNLLKEKS